MCEASRGQRSVLASFFWTTLCIGFFLLTAVQPFPVVVLSNEFLTVSSQRSSFVLKETGLKATMTNHDTSTLTRKELLCVWHGISEANEMMSQPGNQWCDPTFRNDPNLVDAQLSETGKLRTQTDLPQQHCLQENLQSFIKDQGVKLVLGSPLTRCLQTYTYGVEPVMQECIPDFLKKVPVLAIPLLQERVFTKSDTGRPLSILKHEFPTVNFKECERQNDHRWYEGSPDDSNYVEWRPHGEGQWYAVPGEPEDLFDQCIRDLGEWLSKQKEKKILIGLHWGVLRHLTNGTEWENAEAKLLLWIYCSKEKTQTVSHHESNRS